MKNASLKVVDNTTGVSRDIDVTEYTSTWAKRPDVTKIVPFMDTVFITDVGVNGSYWYSNGTKYLAVGGRVILANQVTAGTAVTSTTAATKTTGVTLPIGLLQVGNNLVVETTIEKTGTAGTTAPTVSLSAVGAEAHTSLGAAADTITSTNLFVSGRAKLNVVSATTVKKLNSVGTDGQIAAIPTAVTVPNVTTTATVLAVYVTNSSAADSSKSHTFEVILETC
jgi:hypothetical protein